MTNAPDALAALADPTRRTVFERLARGPRSVGDIAHGMHVSRPAVSQHLRALKAAKLVLDEQEGTRRLYRINQAGVVAMQRYLDQFWDRSLAAFAEAAERHPHSTRRKEKP